VLEERHDRASGLVAAWDGGDRGSAGQNALFELEVGVDVDLCGGNTFVAESEGDDSDVEAYVQESHGGRVPQHVRRDLLAHH
jgi:hypothetical protein